MTTTLTVTSVDFVTPALKRIWFSADDLSAFEESRFTDRYLKLVFARAGVEYPIPLDMRALRTSIPAEDMPVVRTYTALFPDVERRTLAIDFVIHGDEGVAGPWAASAKPGDVLLANGPGGAYSPDPAADWHLFVGDESAVPAIHAALAELPPDSTARVILHLGRPGEEPDLPLPQNGEITFVYRDGGDGAGDLLAAVKALPWLPGDVHAFVHGEAQEVMHGIRPHLLNDRAVPRARASISGYWRRGRTEESFREWKAALSRVEGGGS